MKPMNVTNLDEKMPSRILVVDDDAGIRQLVHKILKAAGYQPDAVEDALTAQERLSTNDYDVVISDIMMPGMSGIDLLKIIHQDTPDVPVILITGNPNLETAGEAIRTASAVDYLCKPFSADEILRTVKRAGEIKRIRDENRQLTAENERYQLHLEEMVEEKSSELVTAYKEVRTAYDFTLEALVAMIDAREKAVGRHSIRVREFALILAHEMEVSGDELENIARGTLLHDIGKIAIPDSVLLKPGKLTADEWVIMKTHPQIGHDIIQSSEYLSVAAELILSHHEKYDGSGYPRGLKGDEICLGARIFSVVDAYDAMRSVRVYKGAIPADQTLEEIIRCRGTHFDPAVVEVFLKCQPALEEIAGWDAHG
jgi:putative nucleotidyltransferase with HDIG domain